MCTSMPRGVESKFEVTLTLRITQITVRVMGMPPRHFDLKLILMVPPTTIGISCRDKVRDPVARCQTSLASNHIDIS